MTDRLSLAVYLSVKGMLGETIRVTLLFSYEYFKKEFLKWRLPRRQDAGKGESE